MRLRPGDPPSASLALVAAVALHQAVTRFLPGASIKWPNDLMLGDAKLAGILLEREGEEVVIGFGVNLAHRPEGLDRPTICLAQACGEAPDPDTFLAVLVDTFAIWLGRWRRDGTEAIQTAWLAAAHPIGTRLVAPEGEGRFAGLSPDGALRLERPDGEMLLVRAGDVFLA